MPKTDIEVKSVVSWVKSGDLLLPEIQRKFVWPATRVRDLLDSLYRGYPSGTILVWETSQDVEKRQMAIASTSPQTSFTTSKLLLDGQQRITSLASIINGQPVKVRNHNRPINILFNLEHPEGPPKTATEVGELDYPEEIEEVESGADAERDIQAELKKRVFVVASKALQNDPLWVPVTDIFTKDHGDIMKRAGITSLDDPKYTKYSTRLKKVKDIENYQYVMQVLPSDMSYEEVTEIFVRVNSLGIKLRGSDLALSQITCKWKGFMKEMETFSDEFGGNKDYLMETGLMVRMLVTFATHQSRFKTVGKLTKAELESAWELAKKGLRFAMSFLKSNASIENLDYISSPFLLIPIAVYTVHNNERLSPLEEKALLRWFYLAHMRAHYSMGSSETLLDQDLAILFRTKKLEDLLNQLEQHVRKFTLDETDIKQKGIRSPLFSMLYFVLKKGGAKDWWSGLLLSDSYISKAHLIEYHHIFPKSLLKGQFDQKEINEISNLAFIGGKANRSITNKEPTIYFEDIVTKRGQSALESQLIPLDKEMWKITNYTRFLEYRRKAIAERINQFIKEL